MRLQLEAIVNAVQGKVLNPEALKKFESAVIEEVTTDSRKEVHQGLFIPLKGEHFDGHHFISMVFDKGAVATLTMEEVVEDPRLVTILVQDTKKALLDLGCFYRKQFNIPVVGITGSVGKTSTKEMIAAVLSGKWQMHKTEGNFNNEIGLPLTLFKLEEGHEAAIIEMGMNHFGEIHNLSCCALPDVGVITNIGTSHIENLGSRAGILKAKLEILDGLNPEGLLIVNGDNDLLGSLSELPIHKMTYGLQSSNDYWAEAIQSEGEYTKATIHSPHKTYTIRIHALGEHMIYNTLAAIVVAEHYHLSEVEIQNGLESYIPAKMRMHISKLENGITVIDDTYNASPESMKAALKVLKDYETKGKKIAILGDMFEMGEFAPMLHQEVGAFASELGIDELIAVGELARHLYEGCQEKELCKAYYFETKELFMTHLLEYIHKGDCVLLKASRGMHFETLVEEVRKVK